MQASETTVIDPLVVENTASLIESSRYQFPVIESEPTWLRRGKIPALDGLRFLAILGVLLSHTRWSIGFPSHKLIHYVALQGALGVDLFFVISGFLITTLLARELEHHHGLNLRKFYFRRCMRILPAYIVYLLAIAVLQRIGWFELSRPDWVGALTFTTNFSGNHMGTELSHSWSLSLEEHFYLLWPLVLHLGGAKAGLRFAIGCLIGCWLFRLAIVLGLLSEFVATDSLEVDNASWLRFADLWTFTRLDTISMGSLMALYSRSSIVRTRLNHLTRVPLLCAYFVLFCISLRLMDSDVYHQIVGYSLNSAILSLFVWGLIQSKGLLGWIINHPFLTSIGMGSYSLYLWQQLFTTRHEGWIYKFPQNVGLTIFAAVLSFWLIERPINRWKDRIWK